MDRQPDSPAASAESDASPLSRRGIAIAGLEWDLSTDQWGWSPELARLFGLDPDAQRVWFDAWRDQVFFDDVPKMRAAVEEALKTGLYFAEFRVALPDRTIRWFAANGHTMSQRNGRQARAIRGTLLDITDYKELQVRLLVLNETLEAHLIEQRAQGRVLEILNRTGTALAAELSVEHLTQTVTDAAVEVTGAQFGAFFYNVDDDKDESYMLYALSGAPREAFEKFPMPRNSAVFDPTFRGVGVVRSDNIREDPRYGHNPPFNGQPPGHLPVVSYLAVPVVSRSGEVHGGLFFGHALPGKFTEQHEKIVIGIAAQAAIALDNARLYDTAQRELDARRTAEEQLQRINETLEERVAQEVKRRQEIEEVLRQAQKMDAIGQLTGGIAHDFNNMLAIIMGSIEMAHRRLQKGVYQIEPYLDNASEGAKRAATLTQRLLAFSRQQPLAPEIVDPNRLVAGMSELLRRTLGEQIQIETVLAGGLWQTFVDRSQLESAILNLAVNARDAMASGGRLTIETANTHLDDTYAASALGVTEGQYVVIAVTDTGSGMTPDVVAKAFDPFFTTKGVGKGTGLGLSQVYGFVRQSDGYVKIYSEVDRGTTIKIYLQRHSGAGAQTAMPAPALGAELPVGTADEVILVVEDEELVRRMTASALRELGYTVHLASNGNEALQLLQEVPEVTLLFTDVVMPGMSGRELADAAVARWPQLKVLYTTGYTRNAIVHNGFLDSDVAFLNKPFSVGQLAGKIRAVLDGGGFYRRPI